MTTDANLLLVSNGSVPERIKVELEEQGALVETISTDELDISFQVVGPDLIVHFGLAGSRETVDFLRKEHDSRGVRLVMVGPRAELAQLRRLDRNIVLGVLAEDMPDRVICERILSLSSRKHEPHRAISVPSAKVPSVPPEVTDPHLQRHLHPALPPPPLPPPGFERASLPRTSSTPPPSEEKILIWLRSTPPPRISEKEEEDVVLGEVSADESVEPPWELEAEFLSADRDELGGATPASNEEARRLEEEEAPSEEGVSSGAQLRVVADAVSEPDTDDRDTLMMEIDASLIESEDSVADRETVHMEAEPAFDSAEPSVSSVVTDTRITAVIHGEAEGGRVARAWVRWALVALAPVALALVVISRRSVGGSPTEEGAKASDSAALSTSATTGTDQVLPPRHSDKPLAAPAPAEKDPWVRPENPEVSKCDTLVGDKGGLRLGDVDQSALIWKRARGRLVLGDREGAHAELCRAAYIFPSGLAVEALIEQFLDMDAPRKAEPFMEQALKARPHRPKTLELQGDLVSQLGDQEKAREIWTIALGVTDATPKVLRQIARQIVAQAETVLAGGQVGLAERLFRRAAILDKASANALLGLSRIAEGRSDAARAKAFRTLAEKARLGAQ